MNKNFSNFAFSIFDGTTFATFTEAMKSKWCQKVDVLFLHTMPAIEEYFDPPAGGAHLSQLSWWSNKKYPNKVFLVSNYDDGLVGTFDGIAEEIGCNQIHCSLCNDDSMYRFWYTSSKGEERVVQAYWEDRMVFYDVGKPLSIENLEYYKRRFIKKRINNEIIEEYLQKLGINLWDIDSDIEECMTYKQLRWPEKKYDYRAKAEAYAAAHGMTVEIIG